jgi:hypothetical protein
MPYRPLRIARIGQLTENQTLQAQRDSFRVVRHTIRIRPDLAAKFGGVAKTPERFYC